MSNKLINWLIFISLSLIWGSSFILIKEGLTVLTAYQVASIRMICAGIVLLPFSVRAFREIPKEKMGMVIISGIIGNFIPAYLFCIAETKIDSSLAGIMNSLTPLFTILVGVVFYKIQAGILKFIGIVIGLIGLTGLFLLGKEVSFENLSYASLVLLATIFYGINVNTVGKHMKNLSAINIASLAFVFLIIPSSLILFFTGYFEFNFSNPVILQASFSAVLLGIVGTSLASILFYILVKRAGIIFASLVTYGIPFVAVAWGIFYGESIQLLQIGSLLVILSGVYLVNKSK